VAGSMLGAPGKLALVIAGAVEAVAESGLEPLDGLPGII
jgi:hypothetical protein